MTLGKTSSEVFLQVQPARYRRQGVALPKQGLPPVVIHTYYPPDSPLVELHLNSHRHIKPMKNEASPHKKNRIPI